MCVNRSYFKTQKEQFVQLKQLKLDFRAVRCEQAKINKSIFSTFQN